MRIALAILMVLHGIAHLVGFVGSWRTAGAATNPPLKPMLLGSQGVDRSGVHTMGVFWLLTAVAFLLASAAAVLATPWWLLAAIGVSLFSLTLCIIALPETRVGIAVNLLLLAALLLGQRFRLFTAAL
jgi:hypothetical protein